MKILLHLFALDHDPEIGVAKEQLAEDLVETFGNELESGSDIKCSVHDPKTDVILGCEDPETIIETAKGWNTEIKRKFVDAVNGLLPDGLATSAHPDIVAVADSLSMDTQGTYAVSIAARAMDDHWHVFSEYGLYLPNDIGWPCWSVVLNEPVLNDIVEHPDAYAIVNLSVH